MNEEFHISGGSLVVVVILGALLYAALRWARTKIRTLTLSKPRRALADRIQPLVEGLATVAYIVISVRLVFRESPFYSTVVLAVFTTGFIWILWFAIRDVVAGLLLKASQLCAPGDFIEIDGVFGRIKGLGYRVIALDTQDGGQAFVPYSKISRQTLLRKPVADGVFRHTFELTTPQLEVVEGKEAIRRHALNSHWHSVVREPRIVVNEDRTYRVTVFALAPNQGHRIEASVRRALES